MSDLKNINLPLLLVSIGVCVLAGVIGSFFTTSALDTWYAGLNKPSFNPPNWVFGPVWTVLYVMMGTSLYLMWSQYRRVVAKKGSWFGQILDWLLGLTGRLDSKQKAKMYDKWFGVFGLQLVLNTLWSIVFFGFNQPGLALGVIVVLWVCIWLLISWGKDLHRLASKLLIPYWIWVSFATVLNWEIWRLNAWV